MVVYLGVHLSACAYAHYIILDTVVPVATTAPAKATNKPSLEGAHTPHTPMPCTHLSLRCPLRLRPVLDTHVHMVLNIRPVFSVIEATLERRVKKGSGGAEKSEDGEAVQGTSRAPALLCPLQRSYLPCLRHAQSACPPVLSLYGWYCQHSFAAVLRLHFP